MWYKGVDRRHFSPDVVNAITKLLVKGPLKRLLD